MGIDRPDSEGWPVEKAEGVIHGMEQHEENVKKLHELIPDDDEYGNSSLGTLTTEERSTLDEHYKKTNENSDRLVSEMPGEDDDEKIKKFHEIRYNLSKIDSEVTKEDPESRDEEKAA